MEAARKLSPRTLRIYEREERHFIRNFRQIYGRPPEGAADEQIGDYLKNCYPEHVRSASTLTVHVAAIKRWRRKNVKRAAELISPLVAPAVAEEHPRLLADDELNMLFASMDSHICGLMLRLIYSAGIRLREVVDIRVRDADFAGRRLYISDRGTGGRWVSFPGKLQYLLERETLQKRPQDYLFSLRSARDGSCEPVSKRTLQHFLIRAAEELDLGRITVQTLRDNFVVHLMRQGIDSNKIVSIMGYRNRRPILRYKKYVSEKEIQVRGPLIV